MSSVTVSRVSALPTCTLGEGPHWDEGSQALLYVDIKQGQVHRYCPQTERHQTLTVEPSPSGKSVSFVIPVEGHPDLILLGVGRHVGLVKWQSSDPAQQTVKLCLLAVIDKDKPLNRFNDGKCDYKGQLWAGTMGSETTPGAVPPGEGKLFLFTSELKEKVCVDKVDLSNGLAWSSDRTTFYYIDSCSFSVDAFDFDEMTQTLSRRRRLVDYRACGLSSDMPDGMTIDEAGNLWVANYNGAKIICIDPKQSRIIRTIDLPFRNPTSVAWAGPDYATLYVTSSRLGLTEEHLQAHPDNGGVFKIEGLGVRGLPPNKVKLSQEIIDNLSINI